MSAFDPVDIVVESAHDDTNAVNGIATKKVDGANATHVNPLEKIEQLLTCAICLERYKSPKLLPCQHTFCLPCLDSYADSVHRNLKCPECRAEHAIPYEGAKSFQSNYTLMGFLDIHLEATEENAEQLDAYVQRYNRERCKICDEKAELEMCHHCERKACSDCRSSHMAMLQRDLGRLLNQLRRLSNRIKEASENVDKGIQSISQNAETTKAEIKEYFERYHRELKRREEHFISEVDTFSSIETRLMQTLSDVLHVENTNLNDACEWTDAVLSGKREAKDEELCRIKNVFVDGVEYLRNFAPDTEELFSKKIRFSPGDDASKLPIAISNFGELTVSLPQFSGRYLPLEQQYLPRPLKMGLESDSYKTSRRNDTENEQSRPSSRFAPRSDEDAGISRYRRRQQLEDEARSRLRVNGTDSGRSSPLNGGQFSAGSPWTKPALAEDIPAKDTAEPADVPLKESINSSKPKKSRQHSKAEKVRRQSSTTKESAKETVKAKNEKTEQENSVPSGTKETVGDPKPTPQSISAKKPPLPRQNTSADDSSLNEKIDNIRLTHEERVKQRPQPLSLVPSVNEIAETTALGASNGESTSDMPRETRTSRFRIIYRSASSRPIKRLDDGESSAQPQQVKKEEPPLNAEKEDLTTRRRSRFLRSKTNPDILESLRQANISASTSIHTSILSKRVQELLDERSDRLGNSTTHRYCAPPVPRQNSGEAPASPSVKEPGSPSATTAGPSGERKSRFRRRSSIVPDRELSTDSSSTPVSNRLARASSFVGVPFIDYGSKHKPRLVFGRRGQNAGEMNWPRGIAAMPGNEFAVCDSSNHRVQIFNANGRLLRAFGKYGTEEGELDSCAGIAYNRYRQQLVVSDRYNHRIQVFEIDGTFVRQFGSYGVESGKFNNPWGVAVDELGLIYVVDKDNHRVQVFDQSGNFSTKFGSKGDGVGQFNHPLFIALHKRTQNIYVSDSANHRICVFDHDGTPILNFGVEGFHTGELKLPRGLVVDDQGYVTVADSGNNRLQVFSPDGKFIYGFGTWGTGPGQLKGIEGVALMDAQIIVSDRENHRVQIF